MRASSFAAVAAFLLFAFAPLHAAEPTAGVVGKDGWLFYRYEAADATSDADIAKTVRLIARVARVFERNGVALVVTMVPLKMRVYSEHLPADFKLTPQTATQYDRVVKSLRAEGVRVIDMNQAFLTHPKRATEAPLYFRLDSHWSPTGALAAAEAIRAGIEADPDLKRIYDAIPPDKTTLQWDDKPGPTNANDLVPQIPKGVTPPTPEVTVPTFVLKREKAASTGLLDEAPAPAITLMGSSYTADWTLFPDALRHALQRDVLSVSVPASQGSWVGLETYLRDESFQQKRPKIVIWEWPERDLRAVPSFRYREARYRVDDTEWLLRAAAWIESTCRPGAAKVASVGGPLASGATTSKDGDFYEVTFDQPLDRLEYFSAQLLTRGSTRVRIEATGGSTAPLQSTVIVPGDDTPDPFRVPLLAPPSGRGYDKLRIYPGPTRALSLKDAAVCRQADDLLK